MLTPQTVVGPDINPGCIAVTTRFNVLAVPFPHALVAAQEILPPDVPFNATVTDVPVLEPTMVPAPVIVQLYPVAPVTGAIEYVAVVNPQTLVGPDTVTGAGGTFPVTFNAVPGMFPQLFTADTFTCPETNAVVIDTLMEVVP